MTSQVRLPAAKAGIDPATACADIDLAAFRSNVAALRRHADVPVMIVVKADGYGHGMLECAREARAAGAEWLGVATPAEALQLREAGDSGPILAWLYGVDEDLAPLVAADVDVSAQSVEQLGSAGRCRSGDRATCQGASQDRHRAFPQRDSRL